MGGPFPNDGVVWLQQSNVGAFVRREEVQSLRYPSRLGAVGKKQGRSRNRCETHGRE